MKALFKKILVIWGMGNTCSLFAVGELSYSPKADIQLSCNANSHYFAIDIPHFMIYPLQEQSTSIVRIQLHLHSETFPAFYDRPVRKIFQTRIEDVLVYLYCSNKRDLTLTLMVASPLGDKLLPLAFRVQKSTYQAVSRKIEFIAELVQSPALEVLKQASLPFKGGESSLLIDG